MIPIDKPFRTQEYKVAKARISELAVSAIPTFNTSSLSQVKNVITRLPLLKKNFSHERNCKHNKRSSCPTL